MVLENGVVKFNVTNPFLLNVEVNAGGGNDQVFMSQYSVYNPDPYWNSIYNLPHTAKIDGGSGNDTVRGGNGSDFLIGGIGNDYLYGNGGHDTLYGRAGDDRIYGGSGRDGLFGGEGKDYVYGEADADRILEWISSNGKSQIGATSWQNEDALIYFRDTTSDNPVNTNLKVNGTSKLVTLKYRAANWSGSEIEKVDKGLKWAHDLTRNTKLLKTSTNQAISFDRFGSYIQRNATDGVNDAEDLVANQWGPKFDAWNLGSGKLGFTSYGIADSEESVTVTTLHEIAHNWDSESVYWGMFLDVSGWREKSSGAKRDNENESGNQKWYYNKNAEFYRTYSKHSPYEDWATTFEAYYLLKTGQLSEADANRLALKLDFIDAFVDSMKS